LTSRCRVKPHQATLRAGGREEVTTEGRLDVVGNRQSVATAIQKMKDAGIYVSLFLDPDPKQIELGQIAQRPTPSNCTRAVTRLPKRSATRNAELAKAYRRR